MDIQKFRIKRTNPDIHWELPCSGGTNFWPINTSINCSGVTMYATTGVDIMEAINGDILTTFPEELKHCSLIDPCVVLWNTGPSLSPNHCTSIDGFLYVLFQGLKVTYLGTTYTDSFDQVDSVISIGQSSSSPVNIEPSTFGCQCLNPLGDELSKIPVLISQDFNDIGHYSIWDGNISQKEVFANFVFSGVSNGGYGILVSNTTDFGYYEQLQQSPYTIDWGDGTSNQYLYFPNLTTQAIKIYGPPFTPGKYNVVITQDSPWGPLTTMKVLSIPQESYPIMAGSPISLTNPTLQMDQASPLQGPTTYDIFGNPSGFQGASTGYFNQYNVDIPATGGTMPMDAGTHINQYSGMTFGPGSLGGQPCYTVSGITTSILGNFQTYTPLNTPNLPPGYNAGITVPIGGDVEDPVTGGLLTGVYGVITLANAMYTAYTISSAANSTGTADGDTPIQFWDFTNGITIFEATSCGLDNLAWGAEECIACPSGDCEYCTTMDEYVDRVTGVPTNIGPGIVTGDWSPSGNYIIGDIVYDVTYNSCCCFIAVTNISSGDPWFGAAPVTMEEGKYNDAGVYTHVWEACSHDCVACPPGTQTPCDDFSVVSYFYSPGNSYNNGNFVEDTETGNCYMYLGPDGTIPVTVPTGYTTQYATEWDYIGCVSWICPTEAPEVNCDVDCIANPPINGIWSLAQMNIGGFGWPGGLWDPAFTNYIENDTANYLGICYVCIEENVGSSFPCSEWNYGGFYGTPDVSTNWQACPLPSSTSMECIMISGATLDTFDQYGNPITITGFPVWIMCDDALASGTCFESKWKCVEQYSCQDCIQIYSDDPVYFTPLAFATEPECLAWCQPPAYSCSTPYAQGVSCCSTISCFNDSVQYVNTMIAVGAASSTYIDLAYTWGLYLDPPYSNLNCNNGVLSNTMNNLLSPPVNIAPLGDLDKCCIDTAWHWNCEFGCQAFGGIPTIPIPTIGTADPTMVDWLTEADCENNMLIFYSATLVVGEVPCSWWCCEPYLPYNPPIPGPYQSPCVPCFSQTFCVNDPNLCGGVLGTSGPPIGAGPFATEIQCALTGCTLTASCWTCDCDLQPVCNNISPCPTLLSTNPDTYGPDPTGGLNGIPSWEDEPQCVTSCTCTFGWDCFLETGTTGTPTIPPINVGCQEGFNPSTIQILNWQPSDPDPDWTGYTSWSACCEANIGCCYVECDDVPSTSNPMPVPIGDWPCSYAFPYGPPGPCCDPGAGCVPPSGLPWCFMVDCTNALCPPTPPATLPTCCDPVDDSCDCACDAPVNSKGLWDSMYFLYDTDDAVFWGDTDTDFCCFKCYCDLILPPGTPTPGVASTYDCNHFTPGDPPTPEGIPNCWRNCNKTPGPPPVTYLGATYNPCSACTSLASYECTVDGCIPSICDANLGTGYLFNCYTTPNCDDECRGQCICTDPTPADPYDCTPNCVTYQLELWGGTSPYPTDCPPSAVSAAAYPYISYNECMGINPVNASLPDCCPILPPQWYCDDSSNCNSNIPQVPGTDGVGCVGPINTTHSLYQNPITTNFTSLINCEAQCKWCCDPNGVTTCQFVGAPANCAGNLYISAIDCSIATTTNTPCDCSVPPTEWWCHYDAPNDLGGCVSNILGLSDLDLFGTSGLDRATDPNLYFTSLINCEAACKFCCDCDVTGLCYLNWYNTATNQGGGTGCNCAGNVYNSLPLCISDTPLQAPLFTYPCVVAYPEIYCDDILGCRVYPVINNLMSGPYTGPAAMTTCQLVCQFECNQDCSCEFTATPIPWPSPCYDLACCLLFTNNNVNCCKCDDCITNSPHPYSYEVGGVLVTSYMVLTSLPSFPVLWDNTAASNASTYYDYGDVVVDHDGCCYILVLSTSDWLMSNTTMTPHDYYNLYMNELNNTGLPQLITHLAWIPCNPDCPVITYEENWWCDANSSYNWVPNNCVREHPWITTNVAQNAAYGSLVFGQLQVDYNSGGVPFASKSQCEENCRFCCEPESGPDQCCCCDDDGTGNCSFGTQAFWNNPMNLPCYLFCPQQAKIECTDDTAECCCCEDDGQGGCVNGTVYSYANPMNLPCSLFCPQQEGFGPMIECPPQADDCCCCVQDTYLMGCVPGTQYNPNNPTMQPCHLLCNQLSEIQCAGEGPAGGEELIGGKRGQTPQAIRSRIPGLSSAESSPSLPSLAPCCVICETPSMSHYIVYGSAPCNCNVGDTNIGPCTSPVSNPCELDWACQHCAEIDCYPSFYSCATLTNDCLPEDCADCLGDSIYYQTNQPLGYWNPYGNYFNVPATYDGWDGTNTIPYSSPQTWVPNQAWWNWGQIVIDPNDEDRCCWVRVKRDDVNNVPSFVSDAFSPREHYCNYLSGNSADGANMFSPNGGTVYTLEQGEHPWWIPCDINCPSCIPGGVQHLSWKCMSNQNAPCLQGPWAYNDPDTFDNQADCDNLCRMYLCNSNPYFHGQAKCTSSNHNGVIGDWYDNMDWFVQHANDALIAMTYIFTNSVNLPQFPPAWGVYPCPIQSGPNCCGWMASVDSIMGCSWNHTNPGAWGFGGPLAFSTWGQAKTQALNDYNTDLAGAPDFMTASAVIRNTNCEYTPGITSSHPCWTIPGAGTLALANLYNDSGMYLDSTPQACVTYDATKTIAAASNHCLGGIRPTTRGCHCGSTVLGCDCWIIMGTGTTGGPGNIFDDAYPLDEYTGCTRDCCVGTCECCEPDLMAAGYITPTDVLSWQIIGASQFNQGTVTGTYVLNECITIPHPNHGYPDWSGLWNYGSGTLSGDCCICCVAGGAGGNPDPLGDGIPGDCFLRAMGGSNTIPYTSLDLYEHTGQWVSCGVDETCLTCGTPLVPL